MVMTVTAIYTAHLLGSCWALLERRWPDVYGKGMHCRKPYPILDTEQEVCG